MPPRADIAIGTLHRLKRDRRLIAALPEGMRQLIVGSFAHSFHYVYLTGAGVCLLGFGLAAFIEELPLRSRALLPAPAAPAPAIGHAPQRIEPVEAKND